MQLSKHLVTFILPRSSWRLGVVFFLDVMWTNSVNKLRQKYRVLSSRRTNVRPFTS